MQTYSTLGQPGEFLEYPTNKVVGVFADWSQAESAIRQLNDAGFTAEQIGVLRGDQDAQRIDPTGEKHGLFAQLSRFFQKFADLDNSHTQRHEAELRAGRTLVAADGTDQDRRGAAHRAMKSAGGYFINYYDEWFIENLEA